jgi:phosphoglycerate kinase
VAFHNGVFGMFEDPRFEAGTRNFIPQLKRMKEAGIKVYVGGGEGGTALEKYGKEDWITYCFTAGGTVLNALGSEPVPYLVALKMAAEGMARPSDHKST